MAALTGTLAGTRQGMISFTQQNEQEADRIGIQVLQRSGFDPQAMPTFLEKLLDRARYSTRPPEILLTHPCQKAVWRMRVTVLTRCDRRWCNPRKIFTAKARTLGMYNSGRNQLSSDLLDNWAKATSASNGRRNMAARYKQWKTVNTTRRVKRYSRCCLPIRTMHGISTRRPISISVRRKPAMQLIA